jgi:capsular polysaccharide export protein
VPGGFHSSSGRKLLLRQVIDMMLRADAPYDAMSNKPSGLQPTMRVVN